MNRLIVIIVLFSASLGFIAPHMLTPFLSFQVKHLGGNKFLSSCIFSVAAIASFTFAPILGWLSDRFGRRKILLLFGILTSGTFLWLGFAKTLVSFFSARIFFGVVHVWMLIASAVIADVTVSKDRSVGMAYLGVAIGIGFMGGAFLQSVLAFLGIKIVSILAAVLNLISLAVIFGSRVPLYTPKYDNTKPWNVFSVNGILVLFFLYAAMDFVFVGFEAVFSVWGMDRMGFVSADVGRYFSVIGLVMVIIQLLFPFIIKIISEKWVGVGSFIISFLGFLGLMYAHVSWQVYVSASLLSMASGLGCPIFQSMISQCVRPEDYGSAMGFSHSANVIAIALAPISMGWLYAHYGVFASFGLGMVVAIIACGLGYYFVVYKNTYPQCFHENT